MVMDPRHGQAIRDKGKWDGEWNEAHDKFTGTYTFANGRKFVGEAWWRTTVERLHVGPSGDYETAKHVLMQVTPHWEYQGTWYRADGKGAAAPHMPDPPELRDNGEPPPEE